MDIRQVALATIGDFLSRQGLQGTLDAFKQDTAREGWAWPARVDVASLESLIEGHMSDVAAKAQQEARSHDKDGVSRKIPTDLHLAGPASIDFRPRKVYPNLHSGNILSLALIDFPTWSFSTTEHRFQTTFRTLLCSTAADKNIVLSDSTTGEMVECLEAGRGIDTEPRHGAAVLCVAQSPQRDRCRELVSCGMDSKVVIWDLLYRKPVQVLQDHSKFVVRCAFSPKGDYLATCSYDRTIKIYKRQGTNNKNWLEHNEEEDITSDKPPLIDTRFVLVHTVTTQNNPESIVFVRAAAAPSEEDPGVGKDGTTEATEHHSSLRTWLAYTTRNDCALHYVALPVHADEENQDELVAKVDNMSVGSAQPASLAAWEERSFNTNENRNDFHVSYSLLHLTLHPLGSHIAIQTGDHSMPTSGYAPASSSLSRILLMPLLSSQRTATLWTGIASSGYSSNRHAWLPDGSAAWLTSEEGVLRLIDTQGKIRSTVHAHGTTATSTDNGVATRSTSWSSGGNTIIKDVVVLDGQGTVASCGFDHTIRITGREGGE